MKNNIAKITTFTNFRSYIPKDQRNTWDINSEKFFMIDYSKGNKVYR